MKIKTTWNDIIYFDLIKRNGLIYANDGIIIRMLRVSNPEVEVERVITVKGIKIGIKSIVADGYTHLGFFAKED